MLKSVSSIANAIGALNYKCTWDANANSPALTSSVGTKGDYYVVGTAGATNLNGISNWGVGDWAVFNGSVWQRVEGGADLNGVNLSVSGTSTLSNLTASTALALDASKNVVSVTNTGTGNNVLATSPTFVTPILGTPTSGVVTNLTGTASININGTVGATTQTTGRFTAVGSDAVNSNVSYAGTFVGGGATTTLIDMSTILTDAVYAQFALVAVSTGGGIVGSLLLVTRTDTTYTVTPLINAVTTGTATYSMSGSNLQVANGTGGGRPFYTRYVRMLDLIAY